MPGGRSQKKHGGRSPSPSPANRKPEKKAVLRVVCAGTPECNGLYYEADEGSKYIKVDDPRVEIVGPRLWKIRAAPGQYSEFDGYFSESASFYERGGDPGVFDGVQMVYKHQTPPADEWYGADASSICVGAAPAPTVHWLAPKSAAALKGEGGRSSEQDYRAIMTAVRGNDATTIRRLLENGGNDVLEKKMEVLGTTVLMQAALMGNLEAATALLDKGAAINMQTTEAGRGLGRTALLIAADGGEVEIVKLLVSRGADPLLKGQQDAYGAYYTPRAIADKNRSSQCCKYLHDPLHAYCGRNPCVALCRLGR